MGKNFINTNDECITKYFIDIHDSKSLTFEEEVKLAKRIQTGDESAGDELVFANLKFVVSIAKQYQGNGIALPDLINDGNEGLIKAATRFNPDFGCRFISYAVWWIRQSIIQGLNENSRMVRLPANLINKLNHIKKYIEKFEMENERSVAAGDTLNIEDNNILTYEDLSLPTCSSLNFVINEDGDEIGDLISETDEEDGVTDYGELSIKDELEKVLECLTNREKRIIELYFGLNNEEPTTLEFIGEEFGLTKERVRQIKEKAIRKIRNNIGGVFNLL